ncbi:hypothetical protein BGX38DRAFT_1248468 [Terfezia claveryi]|nr:hypothetical protein BGX38DRAFT_1248468 [Terfezia claveryi]
MASIISSIRNSISVDRPSKTPPPVDHRINLRDNTGDSSPVERASSTRNSTTRSTPITSRPHSRNDEYPHPEGNGGDLDSTGGRGPLRKAMARRKYSQWSAGMLNITGAGNAVGTGPEAVSVDAETWGVTARKGLLKKNGSETQKREAKDKLLKITNDNSGPLILGPEDEGTVVRDNQEWMNGLERTDRMNGRTTDSPLSPRASYPRAGRENRWTTRQAEIDVLYENQRGFFLCGIPLFSSKSLLNLDPSPWQTRDFKYSPVSILDKQTPDPSWEWVWKTWYVDMTTDVDDQGWMYSFSFNKYFSWHGTHVWFHSFVRRRRWLRKRVKIRKDGGLGSLDDTEVEAHGFNQDYFTIHSRQKYRGCVDTSWRVPRQSGSMGGAGWGGNATRDTFGAEEEGDILHEEEEISDVPTLMRVLRRCTLDRQKIKAIARFVEQGGAEVSYLAERMPALMSLLMFQASRRQLLAVLNRAYYKAEEEFQRGYNNQQPSSLPIGQAPSQPTSPRTRPPTGQTPSPNNFDQSGKDEQKLKEERHLEGLREAVKVAGQEVRKLEFWSDIKGVVKQGGSGRGNWSRERRKKKRKEGEGMG